MLIYLIYITVIYGIYIIMVEIYGSTEHYLNIGILHKNVKAILLQLSQVLHNAVQTVVHVLTQHNSTQ